ncbi:MAG: GspH/FimT family pseudopilin [Bacillota bacterium]
MRSESGVTLIELVVVLAVLSLATSLALLSGSAVVRSSQASRAASRLLDHIAIARMSAVAQTAKWRLNWDPPATPGSTVVRGYRVESCVGSPCASWVEQDRYQLEDGLGLAVPMGGSGPNPLQFNPDGFYSGPTVEITVCRVQTEPSGAETCQSGYAGRTIRIHANTGVIEH